MLLVDDDVEVRTLLADMLDHRVEMADTGEEALTLLAARSFDVILTRLPAACMDGAEFYRTIEEQWPHLARRVAFVTGRAPTDLGLRSGDAPVPILGKPFSFESLEAAIAAVLARATLSTHRHFDDRTRLPPPVGAARRSFSCGIGLLGRLASEPGRLCRGNEAHGGAITAGGVRELATLRSA